MSAKGRKRKPVVSWTKWTPEEDAILAETYPEGGMPKVRARLPHRTVAGINRRLAILGVRRKFLGYRESVPNEEQLAALDGSRVLTAAVMDVAREASGMTWIKLSKLSGYSKPSVKGRNQRFKTVVDVLEAMGFDLVLRRRR